MSGDNGCPYRTLAERYLLGVEEEILEAIHLYDRGPEEEEFLRKYLQRARENGPPRANKEPVFLDPSNLDEVNMRYLLEMARKAASQSINPGTLASKIAKTEEKVDLIFGTDNK